ncbi:MAG: hypothetical protein KM310_07565 [Clostridiales bacterium]|nr:hypothetical protein [Clostridiales bacterium]
MAQREGLLAPVEAWWESLPLLTWETVSGGRPDRVAVALFGPEEKEVPAVRSLALHARAAGAHLDRFPDPLIPGAQPLFSHRSWEAWLSSGVDTVLLVGSLSLPSLIYGGLLGRVMAMQTQPLLRTILPLAQLDLRPSPLERPCLFQMAQAGVEVVRGIAIP